MTREEILERSRRENTGKHDEREMAVYGLASRWGMLVGGLLCVVLVLASEFLFGVPEVGLTAWMVYFAMQGTSNLVLGRKLGEKWKVIYGILELVFALAFLVALVCKTMVAA